MVVANIISAIGNNSSVYPLIVRDCGIEVPTKIALTYNQNKNESKEIAYLAARERFLDEYSTSAVWIGGIPFVGWLCDKFIKSKGLNPNINLKLFKEEEGIQGIDYNIKKFAKKAPEAVNDLIKAKGNKKLYEKLLAGKFIASTTIPILVMGFILPKLIFASSAKKINEIRNKEIKNKSNQINFTQKDRFYKKNDANISFNGSAWISKVANFSAQDKMAVTDGGYSIGRVSTARNKNESYDLGFKMTGMMFLNFVAPKWIEKGLNKITGVELDPIILSDKDFIQGIKDNSIKLPKTDSARDLLDFVDDITNQDTLFVKYAKKLNKIKMLENNIRDPREYVNIKNLAKFRNDIENFMKKSGKSANFTRFTRNAKIAKSANILTNVALSSFLLAYALPKAQFAFRKLITGSDLEPGLAPAEKLIDQNA